MSLPFKGTAEIYFDQGSGEFDYNSPMEAGLVLWPAWQDKSGFGLSEFARSDFGYDGSAAVGFGRGWFGYAEFGFDADMVSWDSCELQAGTYKFALIVVDRLGNKSEAACESPEIVVIPVQQPVLGLNVESYDKQEDRLVIGVS